LPRLKTLKVTELPTRKARVGVMRRAWQAEEQAKVI
jgi:hypothetical protein